MTEKEINKRWRVPVKSSSFGDYLVLGSKMTGLTLTLARRSTGLSNLDLGVHLSGQNYTKRLMPFLGSAGQPLEIIIVDIDNGFRQTVWAVSGEEVMYPSVEYTGDQPEFPELSVEEKQGILKLFQEKEVKYIQDEHDFILGKISKVNLAEKATKALDMRKKKGIIMNLLSLCPTKEPETQEKS